MGSNEEHTGEDESPSLKQRLHAATGDRDAEAEALAEESDESVTEEDARTAILRVRGEDGVSGAPDDKLIATPEDAEEVAEERTEDET